MFIGNSASGSYLGAVGAFQTKEFEIPLGGADNGFERFYADPQNCIGITSGQSFSLIEFKKDRTTTIIID